MEVRGVHKRTSEDLWREWKKECACVCVLGKGVGVGGGGGGLMKSDLNTKDEGVWEKVGDGIGKRTDETVTMVTMVYIKD